METKKPSETAEALNKDLATLKQDVAQIATDLKGHATAHTEATRALINAKIKAARDAAAARPFAILGVGFLLGFLFAIRFRK